MCQLCSGGAGDAVAARAFGFVEGGVGAGYEFVRLGVLAGCDADTDRGRDGFGVIDRYGLVGNHDTKAFGEEGGGLVVGAGEEYEELFAAPTSEGVIGA